MMGSGGGRVIIVHTFYSNDRSSNLAEASRFFVKFVLEMSKNKQKESSLGQFLKKSYRVKWRDHCHLFCVVRFVLPNFYFKF